MCSQRCSYSKYLLEYMWIIFFRYVSESYKQKFFSLCALLASLSFGKKKYKFDINFEMTATKNRRELEKCQKLLIYITNSLENTSLSHSHFHNLVKRFECLCYTYIYSLFCFEVYLVFSSFTLYIMRHRKFLLFGTIWNSPWMSSRQNKS